MNEIHFSKYLPAFDTVTIFYFCNSNTYVVMSHLGLYFHFPNAQSCWTSFHVLISHSCILFGERPLHIFCPFSNWLFYCWVLRVLLYSRYEFFVRHMVCKYFVPVSSLSFHPLHMIFCTAKVFNCDAAYQYFSFLDLAFGVMSKNSFPKLQVLNITSYDFFYQLYDFMFTFKSVIHFWLIFAWGLGSFLLGRQWMYIQLI